MRDSSGFIEKLNPCDVDGRLMKFSNENHLMVHKKRHDMVLNISLGQKGNTFSDQTPTPTRFIRNCEEVGLFQDLQNVNPFEETFRKAVEAVKTGQAPSLEKSFQSSQPDDTLHTPNVFPHITNLECTKQNQCVETKQTVDDPPKKSISKSIDSNEKDSNVKYNAELQKLGKVSHKNRKHSNADYKVVEVPIHECHQLIRNCDKVVNNLYERNLINDKSSESNITQTCLKEKLKSNIYNRQIPVVLQLKVPIPQTTATRSNIKSQKNIFSTFSRNLLKYESKLENPQSGIFDVSKKQRLKKNCNGLQKQKLEILERNRAAATRCREKKKKYVLHLEKLNRELTETNQKLQLQNVSLTKKISFLETELLKFQSGQCRKLDENVLTKLEKTKDENVEEVSPLKLKQNDSPVHPDLNFDNETSVFDTVEVPLTDDYFINEDGLLFPKTYPTNYSGSETPSVRSGFEVDKFRKAFTDHSYFNHSVGDEGGKVCLLSNVFKPKFEPSFSIKESRSPGKSEEKPLGDVLCVDDSPTATTDSLNTMLVTLEHEPLTFVKPLTKKNVMKYEDNT